MRACLAVPVSGALLVVRFEGRIEDDPLGPCRHLALSYWVPLAFLVGLTQAPALRSNVRVFVRCLSWANRPSRVPIS